MTAKQIVAWIPGLEALPPWLIAVLVFAALVSIALALQSAIFALVRRYARDWQPVLRHIFQRTHRIARYAVFLFAVAVSLPLVPLSHDANDTLRKGLAAAVIILIGWIAIIACEVIADRYVGRFDLANANNLMARKAVTQTRVLRRAVTVLIGLLTGGMALMMFDSVRQYGVSLFASAGAAGLIVGLAARPVFANLIAGLQIAITQPIRIDDVVIVEGEWGRIEEITATYVVVRIWDLRRLIVPLTYFLEQPFQNWTHTGSSILGSVFLYVDYTIPVERVRAKVQEIVKDNPLWDGVTAGLQVTDAKEGTLELRALVSAANSSDAWDLRCAVREALIGFIQSEFPQSLPRRRTEWQDGEAMAGGTRPGPPDTRTSSPQK